MDETRDEIRKTHEDAVSSAVESELTDEQLQQLAEGASSWGANCNKNSNCQ